MAGNTLNIRGLVKTGNELVTTGYVKAVNTNKPTNVAIVAIGRFEDGMLEAGRYDIWFKVQSGEPDVFAIGDIFQVSVYNSQADATADINSICPAKYIPATTQEQFSSSLINYAIQTAINALPDLPVIRLEDNLQYINNSNGIVDWTWIIPVDPEADNIHFQLEWSQNSTFPAAATYRHTTNPKDNLVEDQSIIDRQYFSYERIENSWTAFPSTGVNKDQYGKRCRFRKTLPADGIYYWRVRATDTAER